MTHVVAVIGKGKACPPEVHRLAFDVGYLLNDLADDVVLVTGGLGGVMRAAALGYDGPTIGLRPGRDVDARRNESFPGIVLDTGLTEATRNVVTASAADAVIVLPGSHGTMQEALTALDVGCPLLVMTDESHDGYLTRWLLQLYPPGVFHVERDTMLDTLRAALVP